MLLPRAPRSLRTPPYPEHRVPLAMKVALCPFLHTGAGCGLGRSTQRATLMGMGSTSTTSPSERPYLGGYMVHVPEKWPHGLKRVPCGSAALAYDGRPWDAGRGEGWQRKGGWESAVNAVVEHGGKVHAVMVCVNMCRQWWRNAGQLSLLSMVRLLRAGGPLRSTA